MTGLDLYRNAGTQLARGARDAAADSRSQGFSRIVSMTGRYCVAFGLLTGGAAAEAQESNRPEPNATRTVVAERLAEGERIDLDGIPNEPVWARARPASGFLQREPENGLPASERTDVRIVYDADRLILGVVLHDREPDAVLINQMQRDESFDADDTFAWVLDTFLDGRTGYYFEINPAGAMADGLVIPSGGGGGGGSGGPDGGGGGGGDVNRSWDGIWIARARRTPTGWTAEVEIPFRTLNFNPGLGSWGINFGRSIRRRNEESVWSGHALNQGLVRLVNAGRLEGLRELTQGIGLDLKPYVVGTLSAAPGRGRPATSGDGDAGFDLFYNVTPALRVNFSVNTDFAETQVDQRRVNLTRFPLFYEEKRDFFLEGSSYFDFGRFPGRAVTPFFSRRIGRGEDGTPQRIDVGGKLTGRAGAFDVGVLHVRTAEQNDRLGEDFSIARVRRRLFEQSYVGVMYTRRLTRDAALDDRHTVGLDFALQTSRFREGKNLEASGFYLWTSDALERNRSAGYGARLAYPNDPWTASVSALELQPGYDPAVGFVERRGYREFTPAIEWSPRLRQHAWIRGLEFGVQGTMQTDMRNELLTREFEITAFQIDAHDGGRYEFVVIPQYERLEEDFEISDDVVLPAGGVYRFHRYEVSGETSDQRPISIGPEISWGDFFSGRRRDYSIRVGVRPRLGVSLGIEAERSVLDLAEGSFTADVFRLNANTQFSPWISLGNDVQYDTVSDLMGWQLRFRWIRRPGNDLFFVYTHNWQRLFDVDRRRFDTLDSRLATKIVYTLRF